VKHQILADVFLVDCFDKNLITMLELPSLCSFSYGIPR